MTDDLDALLSQLVDSGVPFVLIGGLALGANGVVRFTEDVDVLLPDSPAALTSLRSAAESWGARLRADRPLDRVAWDGTQALHLVTPWGPLDVLVEAEEIIKFDEVVERAHRVVLDGRTVHVAALQDLVTLKRLADRPQDRDDLRRLREAHGELPGDEPA